MIKSFVCLLILAIVITMPIMGRCDDSQIQTPSTAVVVNTSAPTVDATSTCVASNAQTNVVSEQTTTEDKKGFVAEYAKTIAYLLIIGAWGLFVFVVTLVVRCYRSQIRTVHSPVKTPADVEEQMKNVNQQQERAELDILHAGLKTSAYKEEKILLCIPPSLIRCGLTYTGDIQMVVNLNEAKWDREGEKVVMRLPKPEWDANSFNLSLKNVNDETSVETRIMEVHGSKQRYAELRDKVKAEIRAKIEKAAKKLDLVEDAKAQVAIILTEMYANVGISQSDFKIDWKKDESNVSSVQ